MKSSQRRHGSRTRGDARPGGSSTRAPAVPDPFDRYDAFVGFEPSTSAANQVLGHQRSLMRALGDAAERLLWIPAVELRANLRHLGPVLPEHLEFLGERLQGVADEVGSLPLEIDALVGWPPEGPARRVWARLVEGPDRPLTALRETVDGLVAELGFDLPDHPFEPHFTIAVFAEPEEDRASLDETLSQLNKAKLGRFWLSEVAVWQRTGAEPEAPFVCVARARLPRSGAGGVRTGGRRNEAPPSASDDAVEAETGRDGDSKRPAPAVAQQANEAGAAQDTSVASAGPDVSAGNTEGE